HRAEHVAAHDPGADILKTARGHLVIGPRRAAALAMDPSEGAGRDEPFMQGLAAAAQRLLAALIRSGPEAVERYAEWTDAQLRHGRLLSPSSNRSLSRTGLRRKPDLQLSVRIMFFTSPARCGNLPGGPRCDGARRAGRHQEEKRTGDGIRHRQARLSVA